MVGLTRLPQPAIQFVLVLGVIHGQFKNLAPCSARRLVLLLSHRTLPPDQFETLIDNPDVIVP
jgi:hypothetical protein